MKPCPDYKEILWLDVYGELNPHQHPAWEKHLQNCEACRQERKRILELIQIVKTTMTSPSLAPDPTDALASSIAQKIRNESEEMTWKRRVLIKPHKLIPALVMAFFLIVALGWFSLKGIRNFTSVQRVPDLALEEQVSSEDLDIIKNLELLREMEVLEKLVKFLDKSKYGNSQMERESKIDDVEVFV